jgi:hypothetical protein
MSPGHEQTGNEHNGEAGGHHAIAHHGPRPLPASFATPEIVTAWRTRLLIVAVVATLVSVLFAFTHEGRNHLLRAYLMAFMTCFGFAGGGLVVLMLQHVTGGKWGLLIRRPLEAMSRTIWLVALMFVPIAIFMKYLYQWAAYPNPGAVANALSHHWVTLEQAMTINDKHAMLNPVSVIVQTIIIFGILLLLTYFINKWSLQCDADPLRNTQASYDRWRTKFENLCGIGIFIYVVLLTVGSIDWIKSLDITWYSSIYGLQFLVGQGYAVLALGVLTVILLSKFQPMKTLLRMTEQHDLGKLMLAFVMLNIYLCFAEFLIIWSGNIPDEIPWYLHRIYGGWWTICSLDFICHWLVPFCLLLSRDLKRNKRKMIWLCSWMLLARCIDMFWLIEPNFADAAGNLHIRGNIGILAYITVPVAVLAVWGAYYLTELKARPIMNVNDPHLEEMLEPEHAH